MRKIVIAGGTGFLGRLLAEDFIAKDSEVVILTRSHQVDRDHIRYIKWDSNNSAWTKELEHAEVLINLCGRSVDCRYNSKNRQEIYSSRLDTTRMLGEALQKQAHLPKIWINSSSATIYRHAEDREMDEKTGVRERLFS